MNNITVCVEYLSFYAFWKKKHKEHIYIGFTVHVHSSSKPLFLDTSFLEFRHVSYDSYASASVK